MLKNSDLNSRRTRSVSWKFLNREKSQRSNDGPATCDGWLPPRIRAGVVSAIHPTGVPVVPNWQGCANAAGFNMAGLPSGLIWIEVLGFRPGITNARQLTPAAVPDGQSILKG